MSLLKLVLGFSITLWTRSQISPRGLDPAGRGVRMAGKIYAGAEALGYGRGRERQPGRFVENLAAIRLADGGT